MQSYGPFNASVIGTDGFPPATICASDFGASVPEGMRIKGVLVELYMQISSSNAMIGVDALTITKDGESSVDLGCHQGGTNSMDGWFGFQNDELDLPASFADGVGLTADFYESLGSQNPTGTFALTAARLTFFAE